MIECIKIKSENNNEFIKVQTYFSEEKKALMLSLQHIKKTITKLIDGDELHFEFLCPSEGILIKLKDMQIDDEKLIETFMPNNIDVYLKRICIENNLIIE